MKLPHFSVCFYLNKSAIVLSSITFSDCWSFLCCWRPVMDSPRICDSQAAWLSKALPQNLHTCAVAHIDPKNQVLSDTHTHAVTHTYSPTSHRLPSQPSGQKHWKELIPSMQVPPFLQGDDAQSLMSAGRERRDIYRCSNRMWIFFFFAQTMSALDALVFFSFCCKLN